MPAIPALTLDSSTGQAHELLNAVKTQLGSVPNIFLTMAQSPTTLKAYLDFNHTLSQGSLAKQLVEQIAVAVAGINQCDYCASAHTALGKGTGLDKDELASNLRGQSQDSKTQAALTFCRETIEKRGNIDSNSLDAIRSAGYSDGDILEIIAHVALNTFTNYFNRIAQTEIDFPKVSTANNS